MAYLSDQRCSHHGKAANAFVTMGWSAGQVHAVGLALGEVGLASNHAAEFGEVGLGRHCIEGLGWHAGVTHFHCINALRDEWQTHYFSGNWKKSKEFSVISNGTFGAQLCCHLKSLRSSKR